MSPRTPQQFREIREEKMNLIMDVALEHFSNNGFHATTINHIARHAGISKGLMYNYFSSKEDLLAEIINRSITEIYGDLDTNRDGILSADEFEHFLRKAFRMFREKKKFWKLLYRVMLQPGVLEKVFGEKINKVNISGKSLREFSEYMTGMFSNYFSNKKAGSGNSYDPTTEMFMFTNTVKGFAMTYIMADDFFPEDYFDNMTEALIKKYK